MTKSRSSKKPKTEKNGSHDKEPTPSNGMTKPASNDRKYSSQASSTSAILLNILMACCALLAGLVTPPAWNLLVGSSLFSSEDQTGSPQQSERRTLVDDEAAGALLQLEDSLPCNDETLSQFLHDVPIPGLHVACFQEDHLILYKDAVDPSAVNDDDNNNNKNDNESPSSPTTAPASVNASSIHNWDDLRSKLVQHFELQPTDDLHQPWATYSATGEKYWTEIDDAENVIDDYRNTLFLVFQGGAWIWPGVRKGFRRVISLRGKNQTATLETLSLFPLVLSVQGFLTLDECDQIQTTAAPSMVYSGVALMDKDKGRPASDFRTSQTTFLSNTVHPFLQSIEQKTASLIRLPINHQEPVQVLRYGVTEKYDSHHDYFDPSLYQQDPRTLANIQNGRRNRMITVFWYLSNVEQGGETVFPRVDKIIAPPPHVQCETGLRVKPEAGKVIIFYSQTPDGALDPYSLHGACPVKEGIKWAANKWVWNAPMHYVREIW